MATIPAMDLSPDLWVNQSEYPLNKLTSEQGAALLARMHGELEQHGACCLENFLTDDAVKLLAEEARSLVPLAYRGPEQASPYFFNYENDAAKDLPDDHPLRIKTRRRLSQVASDLIPDGSRLRTFYEWEGLARFLAAALKLPQLYRNADRYQALNISVMKPGGCQQWHFDSSPFVITLLLQPPQGGGDFEYVSGIRSDVDEHYDQVRDILQGGNDAVRRVKLAAGTLMLFRGHYSLHRVTEVTGHRDRLQSIFGFNSRPDCSGSLQSSILHYGPRVAQLEASQITESN